MNGEGRPSWQPACCRCGAGRRSVLLLAIKDGGRDKLHVLFWQIPNLSEADHSREFRSLMCLMLEEESQSPPSS